MIKKKFGGKICSRITQFEFRAGPFPLLYSHVDFRASFPETGFLDENP